MLRVPAQTGAFACAQGLRAPALHGAARETDLRPALRGEGRNSAPFRSSRAANRDEPRGQHDRLGDHSPRGPCLSSTSSLRVALAEVSVVL